MRIKSRGLETFGLFDHGHLRTGQSIIAHGAAGSVGSMVVQLAREAGAYVIGTGRAADRKKATDYGVNEFFDLDNDNLKDINGVDLVFDVIGGDIGKRSVGLIRSGGTIVSIVGPAEAQPVNGRAIDFVVEADRVQLNEIVQRVRDGRLRTNIGKCRYLMRLSLLLTQTSGVWGKRLFGFGRSDKGCLPRDGILKVNSTILQKASHQILLFDGSFIYILVYIHNSTSSNS